MRKNDIINYIVENDLHSRFTISIIKKLATSGTQKKDGTISFSLCDSYLDIVNGGYTDLIVEDLKQEVFMELMNLVNCGYVEILNDNELYFYSYIDKNGNIKSYYVNLFHVVRNYMNNQKKHIDRSAICINMYDENNNEFIVSTKNNDYRKYLASELITNETNINSLENVAHRKDIQDIFSYLKFKYPKHYSLMCKVFELLYNGCTYEEVADILNITKNKVRYQINLMRSIFDNTTFEIKYDRNYTVSLFSDTTKNKCTTYYINKETRKETIPVIKKVIEKNEKYNSYPLSCGILDEITKEEIEKARQERIEKARQERIENSTSLQEVYDIKNKCILLLNAKGETVYNIPVRGKGLTKKTIKNNKIKTL